MLNKNIISIIGSRNCSEKGKKLASKFTKELAYEGRVIASGMAKGIDAIAHKKTIDEGGSTIAVLGSGFNHIYPKENIKLYEEILENKGLVISEYEPNIKPESKFFLERNRIISGIALGIFIIEATNRSGTSVTARIAKEQGKKVFALPHEIDDIHGKGTNRLIKNGAILVTSTKDIIQEFDFLQYKEVTKRQLKLNTIKDSKYREVYNLILNGNTRINDICRNSKKTIKEINNIIFMLEFEGFIRKEAGEYICI